MTSYTIRRLVLWAGSMVALILAAILMGSMSAAAQRNPHTIVCSGGIHPIASIGTDSVGWGAAHDSTRNLTRVVGSTDILTHTFPLFGEYDHGAGVWQNFGRLNVEGDAIDVRQFNTTTIVVGRQGWPYQGLILSDNGTGWQAISPPAESREHEFYAVDGASTQDYWVGGAIGEENGNFDSYILHNISGNWVTYTLGLTASYVTDIAVNTSTDVSFVGTAEGQGIFYHWDGVTLAQVSTPAFPNETMFWSITTPETNNKWIAVTRYGGPPPTGTLALDNGPRYTNRPMPGQRTNIKKETALSATGTFTATAEILHWDGSGWTSFIPPGQTGPVDEYQRIRATAPDNIWAVGYTQSATGTFTATVGHWDGAAWSLVNDTIGGVWDGLTTLPNGDAFTVGGDGVDESESHFMGGQFGCQEVATETPTTNPTATNTATPTRTNTAGPTATNTPTNNPTNTRTQTSTATRTATVTASATASSTETTVPATNTPASTATPTRTSTPNSTPTLTVGPAATATATPGTVCNGFWFTDQVAFSNNVTSHVGDTVNVIDDFGRTRQLIISNPGQGQSVPDWGVVIPVIGSELHGDVQYSTDGGISWTYAYRQGIHEVAVNMAMIVFAEWGSGMVPQPGFCATATPTPGPTACPITYTDVPTTDPFYGFIRCLACRGIVGGYSDGTFRPYNNVTRGQMAKFVANAANNLNDPGPQIFADVPPTHPFWPYIQRLGNSGVVSGYTCGGPGEPCDGANRPYFRPNNPVTRGQLAKFVANAAGFIEPVSGQTFADVPPTHPFWPYIQRVAGHGVVSGYTCGGPGEPCNAANQPYFRPNNNVTRGQTAKFVAGAFFSACVTP